jgi:Domain of unknown function (DUF6471)
VDSNDTVWSRLASRAIRVLLARKEVSYAHLAADLSRMGSEESARSVEGKVQRGTFRFSFFLQSLNAVGADCPAHWLPLLSEPGDWEHRAALLVQQELGARPWLTWQELSRRLEVIGERVSADALEAQIIGGAFPATLFLQCAVVCSFEGLELFLDQSDLREAARKGAAPRAGDA